MLCVVKHTIFLNCMSLSGCSIFIFGVFLECQFPCLLYMLFSRASFPSAAYERSSPASSARSGLLWVRAQPWASLQHSWCWICWDLDISVLNEVFSYSVGAVLGVNSGSHTRLSRTWVIILWGDFLGLHLQLGHTASPGPLSGGLGRLFHPPSEYKPRANISLHVGPMLRLLSLHRD